jgi:hypothetical protein
MAQLDSGSIGESQSLAHQFEPGRCLDSSVRWNRATNAFRHSLASLGAQVLDVIGTMRSEESA